MCPCQSGSAYLHHFNEQAPLRQLLENRHDLWLCRTTQQIRTITVATNGNCLARGLTLKLRLHHELTCFSS